MTNEDNTDKKDKIPSSPASFSLNNIISAKSNTPSLGTSSEIRIDRSTKMFLQGKRLLNAGELDKAIESFNAAIEDLKPGELGKEDEAMLHSYLGIAFQKKGWIGYANSEFRKALRINPGDSGALKGIKETEQKSGKETSHHSGEKNTGLLGRIKSFFEKK